MSDHSEVLDYARNIRAANPCISPDELRQKLSERFLNGHNAVGALANPIDWFFGLGAIWKGLSSLFGNNDYNGIKDIIDGVVKIVSEEQHPQ